MSTRRGRKKQTRDQCFKVVLDIDNIMKKKNRNNNNDAVNDY